MRNRIEWPSSARMMADCIDAFENAKKLEYFEPETFDYEQEPIQCINKVYVPFGTPKEELDQLGITIQYPRIVWIDRLSNAPAAKACSRTANLELNQLSLW